jgi:hypothetical protein
VHQKIHQASTHPGLDDSLNLVIRAIGEVGDCPTGVDEDFIVEGIYELGENSQGGRNLEENDAYEQETWEEGIPSPTQADFSVNFGTYADLEAETLFKPSRSLTKSSRKPVQDLEFIYRKHRALKSKHQAFKSKRQVLKSSPKTYRDSIYLLCSLCRLPPSRHGVSSDQGCPQLPHFLPLSIDDPGIHSETLCAPSTRVSRRSLVTTVFFFWL